MRNVPVGLFVVGLVCALAALFLMGSVDSGPVIGLVVIAVACVFASAAAGFVRVSRSRNMQWEARP
ncbi:MULTISPECIES: hypothetical protein [Rhodococcus]|uniref:Uncharacterized protein n=1 Tax=Rhodococcus opacus RKJ300 = JCM 13270 TaxID=1165867 RepID=I0WU23_RHOOP|nr:MULTISPECIES: hypothetical protein [Rhodococcus]EID79889.1 hypothetical protein W59_11211 [Rhodococcus opacus RKJ300 = JCM 13270]KAF0959248.1 hypothetical protein MLGJGCBP_07682 [Rhodococcus sp. T7]QQZ19441.1 hypothetical protein GO592_38715 [Rhodococcus sp. 21391]UOT08428.1 hypothetical protein MPY17_37800 [Rhodococcus opacus]